MLTTAWSLAAVGAPLNVKVEKKGANFELSVRNERIAESTKDIRDAKATALPESSTRIATWNTTSPVDDSSVLSYYAVWMEGKGWTRPKSTTYRIRLKAKSFDPLKTADALADSAEVIRPLRAPIDGRLYLVQFKTQVLEEYRKAIRDLGGEVHGFVPELTHIVRMDATVAERVKSLEFVRYAGPLAPHFKLEKTVLDEVNLAHDPNRADALVVKKTSYALLPVTKGDRPKVITSLEGLGAVVNDKESAGSLIMAELTQDQLLKALEMDTVQWIERAKKAEFDVDNARCVSGANYLEPILPGYTGKGIRGHVMEGIYRDHPDFAASAHRQAPIAVDDGAPDSHGQCTYGEIFGGGQTMLQARGFLPDAQGYYTNNRAIAGSATGSGARSTLVRKLINEHHILFQTASWGNGRTTEYTAYSADMDEMIFELDIPITQSQSNAGDQQSRPQAWAKNIISVGGAYHFNNCNDADDRWQGGGSIGPAADGRVKPDLSSFYDATLTTDGPTGHTQTFNGTSGATPIVAGNVGLCLEMWTNGIFPGVKLPKPATADNRFDNRPHFTTVKALLIASAKPFELPPTTDIGRFQQGWGRPNLQGLYDLRAKSFIVNEDDVLANLAKKTYEVKVAVNEPTLRVTMTYADRKATVLSGGPNRVNNLDLKVTDPNGQVFWGNFGLIEGAVSLPNGHPNTVDTVENVFIAKPQAGTWKIEVIADELNEDGHVETPEIDADYALVALGVVP